ncbi:MAG: hypothetical protein AAF550_08495, partial [Myxococcota bacterium]
KPPSTHALIVRVRPPSDVIELFASSLGNTPVPTSSNAGRQTVVSKRDARESFRSKSLCR